MAIADAKSQFHPLTLGDRVLCNRLVSSRISLIIWQAHDRVNKPGFWSALFGPARGVLCPRTEQHSDCVDYCRKLRPPFCFCRQCIFGFPDSAFNPVVCFWPSIFMCPSFKYSTPVGEKSRFHSNPLNERLFTTVTFQVFQSVQH
jgi:hypothetical protein